MISRADPSIRSLAIQVVMYESSLTSQLRLAAALGATIRHATGETRLDRAVIRVGDCSPWPCLPDDAVEQLAAATGDGVDAVDLTFFDANLGSAGGSNELARRGDEDAILILNPDTYPSPTALTELLRVLAPASVAAAEARQVPIEHPKAYDPDTGDTSWGCGFALLVRRAAFAQVGGFDSRYFPLYCDDVDLSWRLRAAGWSIRHAPRAIVFHDKKIRTDGSLEISSTTIRSSVLARLMLYRRYGRPDLEESYLRSLDAGADPIGADAAGEFRTRSHDGDVPTPIPDPGAAQFVDGEFARHRFGYV